MKKIFLIVSLFLSVFVYGQLPSLPGYTSINARYFWLAGKFNALDVPAFSTTPSLQTGQWPGSGGVGIDSVLHKFFFYSGGVWRQIGAGVPGGSTTQVQYNNAGAFGGITGATTNGTVMTLTSPVINLTSDATGDVYYRNSGGAFTRLPIGTTGQQLTVSGGGLPSWAAAGGSVTSVATNNGTGITGGTITTTGTLALDTSNILTTRLRLAHVIDSLAAVSNPTPSLQDVTDVGNTTTNAITADLSITSKANVYSHPPYSANPTTSLSFTGNGINAEGALLLSEFGQGIGSADVVTLSPVTVLASSITLRLYGNDEDTLATREYARSVSGGGGGGGNTIYTADDAIASDRTVDLNGKRLGFEQGGTPIFLIEAGGGVVSLKAFDNTGGGNTSGISTTAQSTDVSIDFIASFDNGAKEAIINAFADATTSTLAYTADIHTFSALNNQFIIDGVGFANSLRANDGTATSVFELHADLVGNTVNFTLTSDDGTTGGATITGDAIAQTITLTAAGGVIFAQAARLKNYTVATLPAGTAGDIVYVTDALLPSFLTTVAGGGAVVTPVFYDGTNWKSF